MDLDTKDTCIILLESDWFMIHWHMVQVSWFFQESPQLPSSPDLLNQEKFSQIFNILKYFFLLRTRVCLILFHVPSFNFLWFCSFWALLNWRNQYIACYLLVQTHCCFSQHWRAGGKFGLCCSKHNVNHVPIFNCNLVIARETSFKCENK